MSNAIYSPDLYVNGELKLSIKNGQVSRLALPVGEATIEIAPDEHYSDVNQLTLNLMAGTTYFIRVDTTLKIEDTPAYEPYFRSFSLVSIDDKMAINEIAECCAGKNRKTKDTAESAAKVIKTDDSFSVDKTQNPFSH
jgi:capsule polysaccharide modification protein KpsS